MSNEKKKLYDRFTHGDKKTIVREYKKGQRIYFADKSTLIFKSRVKVKVTQSWNNDKEKWEDSSHDLDSLVELDSVDDDVKKVDLPVARLNVGLFGRIKAFFLKEEVPDDGSFPG